MSLADVSDEDAAKLMGVMENKYREMIVDRMRLRTENDSLKVQLDTMTIDRDYWRGLAQQRELERDESYVERQFMDDQWLEVSRVADTVVHRKKMNGNRPKTTQQELLAPAAQTPQSL